MINHIPVTNWQQLLTAFLVCSLVAVLTGCSGSGNGDAPDSGGNDGSGASVELDPLPNPPLTEGPSADDEPAPFDAVFHTVTDYPLVRDTGPRIEADIESVLTEADFAAGLPDPEITVPVGVNPATNEAPFFEGLANIRVEAGQLLEIRYVPRDPEGGCLVCSNRSCQRVPISMTTSMVPRP